MSTIDVIARLQLRGEQFASEGGKQAADLAAKMRTASQDVRASWTSSFAEVQRLAATAFEMPRNAGGSLDLSSEIGQLRQAAAASDERAEAARQMAVAMEAASRASNVDAEALRRDADAASVAALASERDAASIRDRIVALEAVQVELNRSTAATRQMIDTGNRHVVSANQQRQSMQMLGQQTQDFAVQVVSGQSVMTAFTQQIGQAAFALQGMGGRLSSVAAFLGSFGGIVTTTAVIALTPFVAKLLESNDALEEAVDKLKKDAVETDRASEAKRIFGSTLAGVEAELRRNEKALADQANGYRSLAEKIELSVQAQLNSLRASRAARAEQLEAIKAQQEIDERGARAGTPGANRAFRMSQARDAIPAYEAYLKRVDAAITSAEGQLQASRLQQVANVAGMSAIEKIGRGYDDLVRKATERAVKEKLSTDELEKQINAINARRESAIKAERDRQSAESRAASRAANDNRQSGRQIDLAEARNIVASIGGVVSSGLRTIDEQRKLYERYLAGKGPLAAKPGTSDHERGLAIDIPKTAGITLAAVRKAFRDQGVQLSQLLDEGKHIHAAFGRKGSAGDVVSARNAELKAEATEAAKLKRTNDELERSLDQLARRYDPATAAARDYRDAVADIVKLQNAGKLTQGEGFDLMMRSRQTMADQQGAAFNGAFQDVFGADAIRSTVDELNSGIRSATDLWNDRLEIGALNAGEALAGAVGNIANMFGLRIGGAANALFAPGGITGGARDTAKLLGESLKGVGVTLSDKSIGTLTSALAGAATGQIGGSIFSSLTGRKESKTGSALGGIAGELVGKELGGTITKAVGGSLGKLLGGAAGPLGGIVGGIAGSLLGGLFSKAKTGSVVVSGSGVSVNGGNNSGVQSQLTGVGNSIQTGLGRVAEALGASVGDYLVSIGKRDNYYRVSSTGASNTGEKKTNRISGLLYDGTDEAAAVEIAIRDAISDGAIRGISAAAQNVLKAGKTLESSITKAILIESVPRDLKAMLDPVGAAVDDLNRKFQKTVDALKEGGATAEQMAQAEQLYNLQLQQVKSSTAAASSSLKTFLTDLKLGSNSPYSLRDQEATALAQLKPYLDQIAGGQRVDQDKYQAAARTYLDVERQLYGSTQAFFDAQSSIQAATAKAIELIDNAVPITSGVADPFAKEAAAAAARTASNTATGNELLSQLSDQASLTNALLQRLIAAGQIGGFGGFIGDGRNFAVAI